MGAEIQPCCVPGPKAPSPCLDHQVLTERPASLALSLRWPEGSLCVLSGFQLSPLPSE